MEKKMQKSSLLLGTTLAALLAGAPGVLVTDHAGLGFVPKAQAQRSSGVDISIFFDELAPHGRWLSTRRHGYVWVPGSVASDWRPYTDGHWVYTRQHGWLWVSDEPYGWAVYHYGRWGYDDDNGWFWVPGSEWAPAWVSWQYSDEYVGWAALPPSGSGYAFSMSVGAVSIGIGAWRFVPTRHFLDRNMRTHIVVGSRHPEMLRTTRRVGSVRVVNNVVVNNVINVTNVERVVNRKVIVHEVAAAEKSGPITESGQVVRAFRPAIAKAPPKVAPKQAVKAERLENKPATLKVDAKAQGRAEPQQRVEPQQRTEPKGKDEPEQRTERKGKAEPEQRSEPKGRAEPEQRSEPKGRAEPEQRSEPKSRAEPQQRTEPKGRAEPQQRTESKGRAEPQQRAEPKGQSERTQRTEPKGGEPEPK
jgi:hypothetical protein